MKNINIISTFYLKSFLRELNTVSIVNNSFFKDIKCTSLDMFFFHDSLKTIFAIDNLIIKLKLDEIYNIPLPALTLLNIEYGTFAIINKVSNTEIEWQSFKHGKQINTIELFSLLYSGIILIIDQEN